MSAEQVNKVGGVEDGPEVVYVEVPRRREPLGERLRRLDRAWAEASLDAELPARWRERLPADWDGPAGRTGFGIAAVVVVVLWALLMLWLMR